MYDGPSSKENFLYYSKPCPPLPFEQAADSFPYVWIRLVEHVVEFHVKDGVDEVHGTVTIVCTLSKPHPCLTSCTTIKWLLDNIQVSDLPPA